MEKFSYIGNADLSAIEELYAKYRNDPDSVDIGWKKFFEGFDFAVTNFGEEKKSHEFSGEEFNVIDLINAYRERGHLFTKTNPVRSRRKYFPTLSIENFGLTDAELEKEFHAGNEIGIGKARLEQIVQFLQKTYCQSVGVEYMYIRSPEILEWLKLKMERTQNTPDFSAVEKRQILQQLNKAVNFENFIHKKFPGQKSFSLEGAETLIPALYYIIENGERSGIGEFVIGMSHRGRLNVLANILNKPYHDIFSEFEGKEYDELFLSGDVKYHLGYTAEYKTAGENLIRLSVAPNPSHLEAVCPVVEGIVRARIDNDYNGDNSRIAAVLIHGDAAIAGQGIVYEVLQMSQLDGYKTGGTIHLIINNQIGFTTNYLDARSSTYCTDVAKAIQSPIFHVNGDDAEAVVYTVKLAMEFRQKFHRDVFIDLLCYRKWGHNESDEPRFTQPILYKIIETHPDPLRIYTEMLIKECIIERPYADTLKSDFLDGLELEYTNAQQIKKGNISPLMEKAWEGITKVGVGDRFVIPQTKVEADILIHLARKITNIPPHLKLFKKISKLVADRLEMIEVTDKLDWGMCELLAYASLLDEGYPIRVSGQDVERGTFSHRHAVVKIQDSEEEYIPLNNLNKEQASFEIYNSLLSEYAVLGFEYGYSITTPYSLTIWEAQFGDFYNGAQIIIDQYISSAEEKWKLMSGLVMYLPHAYEGQGPEHSSARIERFLSLCANNNMQLLNCSTPANFFHAIRMQILRDFRKPVVIFTPKSLLRHPLCVSPMADLSEKSFLEVIDDESAYPDKISRIVFCSGKIFYELLMKKEQRRDVTTAIIRLEQLYPFPLAEINEILEKYAKVVTYIWVQEEPYNMGPWNYISNNMNLDKMLVISRPPAASPATGASKYHKIQQQKIIEKAFEDCECQNVCIECRQVCVITLMKSEL
jgi:2-oxoglutarate dehydrogenase E1 component